MAEGRFGTAINCIDGRVRSPVAERLKSRYILDFIDTITLPGHSLWPAAREPLRARGAAEGPLDSL